MKTYLTESLCALLIPDELCTVGLVLDGKEGCLETSCSDLAGFCNKPECELCQTDIDEINPDDFVCYMQNICSADLQEAKKKKRKPKYNITYTTGSIQKNIDHFNKMLAGKAINTHTDGLPNVDLMKAAEQAAKDIGTFAAPSPDGSSSISLEASGDLGGGDASAASGDGGAMGESLNLTEKKREVKRYYIRPQNIYCANKKDILNALIDHEDENCSIYTLKNLEDNKDIHKLTNKDIIYYYDNGILYDKNKIRIMDYDLFIKHEEERPKFAGEPNFEQSNVQKAYEDRLTGIEDDLDEALKLNFDDVDAFGNVLKEGKAIGGTCCICGEKYTGYGNNPSPVKQSGSCCDSCNLKFVLPARMFSDADQSDTDSEAQIDD